MERSASPSRTAGPGSRRASRSGSSVRSGRATAAGPASASRSRGSSPGRWGGGSGSKPSPSRAAASPLSSPRGRNRHNPPPMAVAAPQVAELPRRRSPARAALVALRPRQWSKNLLVFAGIVFAAKLGDPVRWGEAVAAFGAYCALSSAAYLVNDLRDREHDRLHPVKRERPVARGELSVAAAVGIAAVLGAGALAVSAWLGWPSLALAVGFAGLQLAYSFGVKHVV